MLRMPRFSVATPKTLDEALALLAKGGAMPIAGGTDVLPALKLRLAEPATLVRLDRIAELQGLHAGDEGLELGAMTRLARVAAAPAVLEHAPALAYAVSQVASPQIRNAATLGGNVLLDTRCRYYNQTKFWRSALGFCLKKDGSVCHVVKGGKNCVAALSSDSVPALMSLGATLEFVSPRGRRVVPVEALFKGDGADPHHRAEDELLVRIRVPRQASDHRGAYLKLRPRGSIDFPQLGVAVRLQLADGAVAAADVVVSALQSRPIRVGETAALVGTRPGEAKFDDALGVVAAKASKQCRPMPNIPGDADWRHEVVPVFVRRAVRAAAGLS